MSYPRPRLTGGLAAALTLLLSACGSAEDPISQQRGRWLLINYWAEWCKPCIREIPELNALDSREGHAVLGVNYDGEVDEVLSAQIEKLGIRFPTLAEDPGPRFGVPRPQVLPTTLVIDPSGKLREVLIGPQTEATLLAATAQSGD